MIMVSPLAITSLAWKAADAGYAMGTEKSIQRVADELLLDLTTPVGQFKMLEYYVGVTSAASMFEISVIATMTQDQWEVLQSDLPIDLRRIVLRKWKEGYVPTIAIMISASLRDWWHLHTRLASSYSSTYSGDRDLYEIVRGVKNCIEPTKLWKLCGSNLY